MKIESLLDLQNVTAVFESSTNKAMEDKMKGQQACIDFSGHVIYFYTMHTSYIKSVTIKENVLTAQTRNSTYIWKLIDSIDDVTIDVDADKIESIEQDCVRFKTNTSAWATDRGIIGHSAP